MAGSFLWQTAVAVALLCSIISDYSAVSTLTVRVFLMVFVFSSLTALDHVLVGIAGV